MSECVVRMDMPKDCWYCPMLKKGVFSNNICGGAGGKLLQGPLNGRPDWCPIVCALPENHGRLVDAEEMYNKSEAFCNQCRQGEHDCEKCNYIVAQGYMYKSTTIVPAERIENK